MCGIWAHFIKKSHGSFKNDISCKRRGPDLTTTVKGDYFNLVFHRLAINDFSNKGNQPFQFIDKRGYKYQIMCNGEIYNHREIATAFKLTLNSGSDCEVLCYLFKRYWDTPASITEIIDGEYSIVALRQSPVGKRSVIAMRDPFGVRPLYWTLNENKVLFSSMLVGIYKYGKADHFPPGHYTVIDLDNIVGETFVFYNLIKRYRKNNIKDKPIETYHTGINRTLTNAVKKRISNSDCKIGFFLSGGLDSSLVCSIANKLLGEQINTFSIGMKNSPDLKYARDVADFLKSNHTEINFTFEEAIEAIPGVIHALETYDITTIRASIPSFILARYISANKDIKVIMNGDGSDEVACGYLYNYNAPTPEDAHNDALRLLNKIHRYDGLRCDRTIGGNGLEARVPFLDPEFVEYYLSIPAELRVPTSQNMEKKMLRDAFQGYLPDTVLYRRKEAFSNGVSDNTNSDTMISIIQDYALSQGLTEPEMYRKIFDEYFPEHSHVLQGYWMPRWSGETTDPSATTLNIYKKLESFS